MLTKIMIVVYAFHFSLLTDFTLVKSNPCGNLFFGVSHFAFHILLSKFFRSDAKSLLIKIFISALCLNRFSRLICSRGENGQDPFE